MSSNYQKKALWWCLIKTRYNNKVTLYTGVLSSDIFSKMAFVRAPNSAVIFSLWLDFKYILARRYTLCQAVLN